MVNTIKAIRRTGKSQKNKKKIKKGKALKGTKV